jgi:hypothetical protein
VKPYFLVIFSYLARRVSSFKSLIFMQKISDLVAFPTAYYKTILNKDLMARIMAFMPLGTIKQIANICNVDNETVEKTLMGDNHDDLILQITLQLFEERFEEYYGEKPTLITLSYLFQDKI